VVAILLRSIISWQVVHHMSQTGFLYGSEEETVAKSIVQGRGFTSPYDATQLTAWIAPAYPYMVALVFRVLGTSSPTAISFLIGLNIFFAGLTSIFVYLIGNRMFGVTVATAAWLWALCLPNSAMLLLIWDACLSALLLSAEFFLFLSLEDSRSYLRWAGVALCCGGKLPGKSCLGFASSLPLNCVLVPCTQEWLSLVATGDFVRCCTWADDLALAHPRLSRVSYTQVCAR